MKKFYLFVSLFLAILSLQNCKKDTVTATANSTNTFFALINDTTWNADTVLASITYNSATKTKVFSCSGTALNKQVTMSVTLNNASNTPSFPLSTYNVGLTSNVAMSYNTKQKDQNGNYVFLPLGTVGPGSGQVIITGVDSVKKVITGTFFLNTVQNYYDNNGNIISVNRQAVTDGAFNQMKYTFTSN
jgi:hypothetical protein